MTSQADCYDDLERHDPVGRETAQLGTLHDLIALAKAKAPSWADIPCAVGPAAVGL